METLIIYVNETEYARNQLAAMLSVRQPTQCVLVGCPPKLNRHISKWISGAARKKWQTQWVDTVCGEISTAFVQEGHQFLSMSPSNYKASFLVLACSMPGDQN